MRVSAYLRGSVLCAAGVFLSACSHVPIHHHHAQQPPPIPSSAAAQKLQGEYDLARYNGQALPAGMRRKAQCVVRITSATLQLHKGRFQLDESLSTHCQGELRSRMLKRASGTVQLHGDRLTLDASNAALFWRASGRIHKHSLVLTEESENGHSRKVKWLFHERSAGKGQNSAHS